VPDFNEVDRLTRYFLISLTILVIVGVIMVFSSSYIFAKEHYGTSVYFFLKQLIFVSVGAFGAWIISRTKFSFWVKYAFFIHLISTFLLLLPFMPGMGKVVKGAYRWIQLGSIGFQPGELIKYTSLMAALAFFDNFNRMDKQSRMIHATGLIAPLIILLLQPDFGTFTICFILMTFVCYLSAFPRRYFYYTIFGGIVTGIPILLMQSYRVKRLFAFLDPWKNAQTSGFQIIQSYLAFANGSVWGQGLGNSNEKLFYLPEAHNDFIFSVMGEELGFMGVFFVVGVFLLLIYFGFRLALSLNDRKGTILISSVVFTLGLQVVLNMGVVLGLLPTKGLNLPFISYGGSSLICNFFGIGLILATVRQIRFHWSAGQPVREPPAAISRHQSTRRPEPGNSLMSSQNGLQGPRRGSLPK
jgi:cell division protein FtsW